MCTFLVDPVQEAVSNESINSEPHNQFVSMLKILLMNLQKKQRDGYKPTKLVRAESSVQCLFVLPAMKT